jgi:hypothetical protein
MNETPRYWFPAKRYGWGWGPPRTWQGWAVLTVFFGLTLAGAVLLLPAYGPAVFVAWCAGLCLLLMLVCWIKGEPPRWRWGGK